MQHSHWETTQELSAVVQSHPTGHRVRQSRRIPPRRIERAGGACEFGVYPDVCCAAVLLSESKKSVMVRVKNHLLHLLPLNLSKRGGISSLTLTSYWCLDTGVQSYALLVTLCHKRLTIRTRGGSGFSYFLLDNLLAEHDGSKFTKNIRLKNKTMFIHLWEP